MMDDDWSCIESLAEMGVFGLAKKAVTIICCNTPLFLSFVTSFTIPCSLFTVFSLSAIDVHHRYVLADFIAPGELVIFSWKFQTLISPFALNLAFILLNLLPVATLNTIVTARGVVSIYKGQDLTTSIKNGYLNIHRVVLRLLATQSIIYFSYLTVFALSLLLDTYTTTTPTSPDTPLSTSATITTLLQWAFPTAFVLFFFHLPLSQVAVLEESSYGFQGVSRAVEVAFRRLASWVALGAFSLGYFCVLKGLVDVLLCDSYPYWTKFVVYPPLVVGVIAMSLFWQVVYTLFYLSSAQMDREKGEGLATGRREDDGVNRPLLVDEGDERSEGNSNNQHGVV